MTPNEQQEIINDAVKEINRLEGYTAEVVQEIKGDGLEFTINITAPDLPESCINYDED